MILKIQTSIQVDNHLIYWKLDTKGVISGAKLFYRKVTLDIPSSATLINRRYRSSESP